MTELWVSPISGGYSGRRLPVVTALGGDSQLVCFVGRGCACIWALRGFEDAGLLVPRNFCVLVVPC